MKQYQAHLEGNQMMVTEKNTHHKDMLNVWGRPYINPDWLAFERTKQSYFTNDPLIKEGMVISGEELEIYKQFNSKNGWVDIDNELSAVIEAAGIVKNGLYYRNCVRLKPVSQPVKNTPESYTSPIIEDLMNTEPLKVMCLNCDGTGFVSQPVNEGEGEKELTTPGALERNGWNYLNTNCWAKDEYMIFYHGYYQLQKCPKTASERPIVLGKNVKCMSEISTIIKDNQPQTEEKPEERAYRCGECGWVGTISEMKNEQDLEYNQDCCPKCNDVMFDNGHDYKYAEYVPHPIKQDDKQESEAINGIYEALKKIKDGMMNLIEYNILPDRYCRDANDLIDEAYHAINKYESSKTK